VAELEILMLGYQRGDPVATTVLIRQVSPLLLRFLRANPEAFGSGGLASEHLAADSQSPPYPPAGRTRTDMDLRYSPPFKSRRLSPLAANSFAGANMDSLPEHHESARPVPAPDFDSLIAVLPPSQREVVSMLKLAG
jgi:hypothetical protein